MKELSPEVRDALGMLTAAQVAALLQVNVEWIYDEVSAGRFPVTKLGRNLRFRPRDIDAYLAGDWVGS